MPGPFQVTSERVVSGGRRFALHGSNGALAIQMKEITAASKLNEDQNTQDKYLDVNFGACGEHFDNSFPDHNPE